jgi:hypothetical protein
MAFITMNEIQYNTILRSLSYLFREYSEQYMKKKQAQALYYQRHKEQINQKSKEKYITDPEYKSKKINQSIQWNKVLRVRSQYK